MAAMTAMWNVASDAASESGGGARPSHGEPADPGPSKVRVGGWEKNRTGWVGGERNRTGWVGGKGTKPENGP